MIEFYYINQYLVPDFSLNHTMNACPNRYSVSVVNMRPDFESHYGQLVKKVTVC